MRSPFGTYLARPSGHSSFTRQDGSIHLCPYLAGIVAESICCQILCRHSLASLEEAVRTILGEPNGNLHKLLNQFSYLLPGRILTPVPDCAKHYVGGLNR